MNPEKTSKTAIFLMPRASSSWEGSEALWITAAGWASAAKKKFGNVLVITPDRIASPTEVYNYPLLPKNQKTVKKKRFGLVPVFLRIFINDLLIWKNLRNWKTLKSFDRGKNFSFIWEKHDLFYGPGKKLSQKLNIPLISYVHAPVVWEASKWGVKRYIWGKWLEKIEAKSLKRADLVAVVSEEVKIKVLTMGIPEEKILISPMAVDPQLFLNKDDLSQVIKEKYNLQDKFVIGWTGSFRKFHGLDHVIKAFKNILSKYPFTVLMLIGDGAERKKCELLAEELEIRDKIIFTGRLPFLEMPQYVSLFDLAVVSAKSGKDFHYSPLKLREYMAAGKAVLAPNAGEILYVFKDEENVKLFEAGNITSLETGMLFLIENREVKQKIANQGKKKILHSGTWDQELKKALDILKIEL